MSEEETEEQQLGSEEEQEEQQLGSEEETEEQQLGSEEARSKGTFLSVLFPFLTPKGNQEGAGHRQCGGPPEAGAPHTGGR